MRIGGSNVSGICGINPYSTPLDEFLKITGQVQTQINPAMEWGSRLESVIRQKYQDVTGREVLCNEDPNKLGLEYCHPDYPYLTGSLDGIARTDRGNRLLEIKTARSRDAWDNGVPEYYQLQCQHYMGLTGLRLADVAVLFGASDFEIFDVIRDDDIIQTVTALLVGFWENHIETGIPPACSTPGDRDTRWPASTATVILGDETSNQLCARLRGIKAAVKALEQEKDDVEAQIKDIMQDADTLSCNGKIMATWKQAKDSTVFEKARFEAENYELYGKYLTTKPGSRRFLLK